MTNNLNYIKNTQTLVKEFEKTKNPEHLNKAYTELKKINLKKEKDISAIVQIRTAALLQWLNLLQILDDNIDPSFDVNKGVSLKVQPKTNYGGVDYPSWVDPKSINDPNALADFQKASAENNKKIQNRNLQISLTRTNQQVTPIAKTFIRKNYTGLPSDQAELRSSIGKILKNQSRKDDFSKLLVPLPPQPPH